MIGRLVALSLMLLNAVQSKNIPPGSVELDTVVMQLRSRVNSDNDELLSRVLDYTAGYMDEYFGAYYANSQSGNYFSYTGLEINSYGIHGVTGSFITTLELDGVLVFNADPTPSQAFIQQLLDNSFQGLNFELFVEGLQHSESQFLKELTHIIVNIGGKQVAQEDLEFKPPVKTVAEEEDGEGLKGSWQLDDWSQIAVYASAGVVGALLIMGLICICKYCCCNRNRKVNDVREPVNLKSINIPTMIGQDPPAPRQHIIPERFRPRSSKRTGAKNNIIYSPNDNTLSPVRSITSQDSSKFTYNPAGMSMLSKASFSVGSLSNFDNQSIDLEAWQRNDAISALSVAPFGHDISAIEKNHRDLSLIEEGDEEDRNSSNNSGKDMTSKHHSRSGHSSRSSYQQRRSAPRTNRVVNYSTESSSAMISDASSDVINDLRNLSLQIESHRRSKKGRR